MARRILLFTGKGGVGKTTTAAATALKTAQLGYKTLVLSVDPAHSLADALDTKLSPEPEEIQPNLFAQELDVFYSMKKHWANIRELMLTTFRWQGVEKIQAEELASLPGMEEASAFLWLEQYYQEKQFDVIVVDSAPTGETLTLLTLPQVTQWWMQRAMPGQKLAIQSFGMMTRMTTGIPLDKGLSELESLFDKLDSIKEVMMNPEITSMRLVMNPERMVINEAQRAYTYLQLYGYPVDATVTNRVLPNIKDKVFAPYLEAQQAYLGEIEESFAPLPVFQVPHLGQEVFGLELLDRIAQTLWGEQDPTEVFHQSKTFQLIEDGKAYRLEQFLPLFDDGKLDVQQFGDSLVIQADTRRRNIILPKFLSYYKLERYEFSNDWLKVWFQP